MAGVGEEGANAWASLDPEAETRLNFWVSTRCCMLMLWSCSCWSDPTKTTIAKIHSPQSTSSPLGSKSNIMLGRWNVNSTRILVLCLFYDLCLCCTEGVLAQSVPVFQSHGWLSFGACRTGDLRHILLTNNQLWIEYVHYHHNQEETTASDWFCTPRFTNARSSLQEGDLCLQKVMTILYSYRQK